MGPLNISHHPQNVASGICPFVNAIVLPIIEKPRMSNTHFGRLFLLLTIYNIVLIERIRNMAWEIHLSWGGKPNFQTNTGAKISAIIAIESNVIIIVRSAVY